MTLLNLKYIQTYVFLDLNFSKLLIIECMMLTTYISNLL